MREVGRALARLTASWQSDAMLGGLTVAWMLGYQQVNGMPWAQRGPAIGFGLAFAATLPLRRQHPVAAGSAFGVILLALSAARLHHAAWEPSGSCTVRATQRLIRTACSASRWPGSRS